MKFKHKVALFIGFLNKLYYLPKAKNIQIGKNFKANRIIKIKGSGHVKIGDNCNFVSHDQNTQIYTYSQNAKVTIGNFCRLNGTIIQCQSEVNIEDHLLAGSCHIVDTNFHSTNHKDRRLDIEANTKQNVVSKSVKIDSDVWLGGESVILKGVHLAQGTVVGMRAIVTKSTKPFDVMVGNPAKPVKSST